MNDVTLIIWGAGNYGRAAYAYYCQKYHDIIYTDNDSQKWGSDVNGIRIIKPDEVLWDGCDVVVAVKHKAEIIADEIREKNIRRLSIFSVNERYLSLKNSESCEYFKFENCFIIHLSGGLGNQLFQYAFYKNSLDVNRNVYINVNDCEKVGSRKYVLGDVFRNVKIKPISEEPEKELLNRVATSQYDGKFILYKEGMSWGDKSATDKNIFDADGGIYYGWFQSCYWANKKREELLQDLIFDSSCEEALQSFVDVVENDNEAVSIHFRRGDYLTERNQYLYGNICTDSYYHRAIELISKKLKKPHFYVFSDDIGFVKEYYQIPNATYIESGNFENYKDWYDMCLMSKCRHNIIANSTFSWWGAWLNTNATKIVIAPKEWINSYRNTEIYPDEWITIGSD